MPYAHHVGVQTGDYVVDSIEIATDLLMGTKIEAILRTMTMMVLRSFGVSPTKAEKVVAMAFVRLDEEAPGKIGWWRPVS